VIGCKGEAGGCTDALAHELLKRHVGRNSAILLASVFVVAMYALLRCLSRRTAPGLRTAHEPAHSLLDHLRTRIEVVGPLTVADYMREVLTNPIAVRNCRLIFYSSFSHHASLQGYYMHRDVFGASGDFTTAPELSQMFGEVPFIGLYERTFLSFVSPARLRVAGQPVDGCWQTSTNQAH
jgi:hypothetical protein